MNPNPWARLVWDAVHKHVNLNHDSNEGLRRDLSEALAALPADAPSESEAVRLLRKIRYTLHMKLQHGALSRDEKDIDAQCASFLAAHPESARQADPPSEAPLLKDLRSVRAGIIAAAEARQAAKP